VERPKIQTQASAFLVDRGNYRHFMAKEIHEQPEVVGRTLAHYMDLAQGCISLPFALPVDPIRLTRITLTACGTAFYAAMVARYWLERYAGIVVDLDVASEYRYRDVPAEPGSLLVVVSQSGETADTLACVRAARERGQKVLAVVNVPTSTIARDSDAVAPTLAGPEIGVASTKAFTCQLAVLACLALALGRARQVIDAAQEQALVQALVATPGLMAGVLQQERQVQALAHDLSKARDVLYLGRGTSYPLALEGALKLKEISYIHAEGYAAGELKHGPIALIDESMPVIVIAPPDNVSAKTLSNLQEVAAREGRIILIATQEIAQEAGSAAREVIIMPAMEGAFSALVYALPIQLLAYYTAVFMGKDVDQPRNLAKSVTVE
jgi:glucosamine--fructose-6-phosphate aminotransferase (isomerizing)